MFTSHQLVSRSIQRLRRGLHCPFLDSQIEFAALGLAARVAPRDCALHLPIKLARPANGVSECIDSDPDNAAFAMVEPCSQAKATSSKTASQTRALTRCQSNSSYSAPCRIDLDQCDAVR
jgi:hypothetical protein